MSRTLYFAYGSNLSPLQMGERCPHAGFAGRATLEGWRWVIGERGVATLSPNPSASVEGVLWEITDQHERTLDACEGVAIGAYEKHWLRVRRQLDGREVSALVYIDPRTSLAPPRDGYLSKCLFGARFFGLIDARREMLKFA